MTHLLSDEWGSNKNYINWESISKERNSSEEKDDLMEAGHKGGGWCEGVEKPCGGGEKERT